LAHGSDSEGAILSLSIRAAMIFPFYQRVSLFAKI
jgi:hypothetical protein